MKHCIGWREVARTALVIGLLAVGASACGDDDDDTGGGAGTGTSGVGASGTGAGASGTSAGGGSGMGGSSGGGAGSGGMAAPMPIMCMPASGAVMCAATMTAAGTVLPPCCDAMEGNACGAIVDMAGTMCIAKGQMGTVDPSCPSAMSVLGMAVPGCCKPNNMCGLQSGTLMGCVERSRYPVAFLATVMGMPPPAPMSMACGGDADGGI